MGHGSHGGTNKARQSGNFKPRNGKGEGAPKLNRSQRMQARKKGDAPRENPSIARRAQ